MLYLKIVTQTPELVPEKYKDGLTEQGLLLVNGYTSLFELMLEFFDYDKLIVVNENGIETDSIV